MFFDIPSGAKVDKYMAGMPTTSWATWTNPRGQYTNAIILVAGGGGGGGTNQSTALGSSGGGAGGFAHIYCPLSLLPDTLYIQVGIGGAGGVPSVAGTAGNTSYVSIYPNANIANLLVQCNGGNGGSVRVSGGSVSGGSVIIYNILGTGQGYTGGSSGVAAATTAASGGDSLPTTGSPIYGGGGSSQASATAKPGGGMTSVSSLYPSIAGGAVGSNATNGFVLWKPFTVFGGSGGSGGTGSRSYNGGNGIMGSGGGGAGGGAFGLGGKGGDGFVIIICY